MYVKNIDKSCLTNPAANSSFNGISFSTVKKKKTRKIVHLLASPGWLKWGTH